jgi:hypothetical protein
MTTRSDDELAVPHFAAELWRELEKLHGSAGDADAAMPVRIARRPRLLVAAAVIAVGGAVAGVALVSGRGEPTTVIGPAGRSTTTADVTTTGTPRPNGVVLTERRNAEGGVHRSWIDEETGLRRELSLDAAGRPVWDSGWLSISEDGDEIVVVTRDVDHCFREYQEGELRVPVETFREATPDSWRVESVPETMIDDGELVADGTEIVDGRELLRYQDVENDATIWLDPETHDFVKRRFSAGTDAEQSEAYEYMARTSDNLAVLRPVVPPGFTTPWTDHSDEERAAAGCG